MSKLSLLVSCSALLTFAACGGGDDGEGGGIDAPVGGGAAVTTEDCATATIAQTIMTNATPAYAPSSVTVAPGAVVRFIMPSDHDVASSTSGLSVGFGATKCLKFATAGTYTFNCTPHSFIGTVRVQ